MSNAGKLAEEYLTLDELMLPTQHQEPERGLRFTHIMMQIGQIPGL